MAQTHNFLSTLTGSFATPSAENPTVAMVEAAYRHHGIDARYINCDVQPADLEAAVHGAVAMGWVGFNCSLPHKVAVIPYLDELAESASIIGAVNCVAVRDGRLVGENTDGQGFLASLRETIDPAGQSVVILGAGGAARAISVELALAGAAEVLILNRTIERGRELAAVINENTTTNATAETWAGAARIPARATIVVNATSMGLFPDIDEKPDVDYSEARGDLVVADVIPNPPRTAFLAEAESRGYTTIDGLGMLVNQGAVAIEHWTGVDPDREVMRETLTEIFGR